MKAQYREGMALFFTLGVSLTDWHTAGFLNREVAYYRRLAEAIGPLTFITYGGQEDLEVAASLDGIRVLSNPRRLPPDQFAHQAPSLYRKELAQVAILKSNQIKGAQAVIQTRSLVGGTAIVRGGYLLSRFLGNRSPTLRARFGLWRREMSLFHQADRVLLPTADDARAARRAYRLPRRKVAVIPNFVDTNLFRPRPDVSCVPGLVAFVGRIAPQKNLPALIEAMAGLDNTRLRIIGDGPDREQIERLAQACNVSVEMIGRVSHEQLPDLLAECEVFVLPSLYEGLPKSLIEAMAAGMPVVATRVQGNEAVIRHGETGWLCDDASPESLRAGLAGLLANAYLRAQMGSNAREYAVDHFSLDSVLAREIAIYREMGLAG
jgi:glycosyltransferase involved in cell wall biosynthesis